MSLMSEHDSIQPGPLPARPLPAGAVGPGSQPVESDGAALEYLSMPGEMQTYRQPPLPEPGEVAGLTAGLALLEAARQALQGYHVGGPPWVLDLAPLDADNLRLVADSLGEGEVSVIGTGGARAQETRLAGLWRVQDLDADGKPTRDLLEIADVPGFVRETAFDGARDSIEVPALLPDGVMNAPGVVAELNEYVARRRRGQTAPHVLNLTLLPETEQDLAFLDERLGAGNIRILSRGYGNCRITASGLRDVWWVKFYNSDDRLILSTLEVTGVPEAALAAQEDIEDSAARLGEILDALR
jgi:hydrogenase-1 operon protein HyaF